jgi:hypothetical protein
MTLVSIPALSRDFFPAALFTWAQVRHWHRSGTWRNIDRTLRATWRASGKAQFGLGHADITSANILPLKTVIELLHMPCEDTLATHSATLPGYPFAASVNYAAYERHRPVMLMSRLVEHTKNFPPTPGPAWSRRDRLMAEKSLAPHSSGISRSSRQTRA